MRIDAELDPTKLKSKAGRKQVYTPAAIVGHLVDGMTSGEWKDAAVKAENLAASTFSEVKKQALADRLVRQDGKAFFRIQKVITGIFHANADQCTTTLETSVRDATQVEANIAKIMRRGGP